MALITHLFERGRCPFQETPRTSTFMFAELIRRDNPDYPRHDRLYERAAKELKFRLIKERGAMSYTFNAGTHHCSSCRACVSLRVNLAKMKPSKSQRRLLAQTNADLSFDLAAPQLSEELYDLRMRYNEERHGESEMPGTEEIFIDLLESHSHVLTARDPSGRLLATAVFDMREEAMLLDTIFYDVGESAKRSLGKTMLAKSLEIARENGVEHVYISYWVKGSKQLGYKQNLSGLEAFIGGEWIDFDPEVHTTSLPADILRSVEGLDY